MAGDLCERCKSSPQLRSEVELILNSVRVSITDAYKRRDTPPHCIFAFENLVDEAMDHIVGILSTGKGLMMLYTVETCVGGLNREQMFEFLF